MFKSYLYLLFTLSVSNCITISVFVGILGPWRQIEISGNHITSNILKGRGFINKIHFEEDEEIDEEEQIESITNIAGLTELEMKSIGQKKVPVFNNLNLIKTIKLSGNQISYINGEFSKIHPKTIDLSYNQINKIANGAFGHSLETLILNCNELTIVSSSWFEDTDSLQQLRFTGNKITVIPADFNALSNLFELHASYNQINKIEDRAFSQKRYTYIDVSYNNLTKFSNTYFSSKKVEIMYLNLRANRLNFLSEEFMKKVSVTVELTADLNPWLCPCNERIRKWLPDIVLYNKKNSWLDAQAFDHAHRKDAYCINDDIGSRECLFNVDEESTRYYFDNIEPFDTKGCLDY